MARPRAFDENEALDAALACFWGRGYEATSIRDLAAAMSVSGPSLYNAFGDKRGLFASALEHYCRTRTRPLLERIEAEHTGAAALAAFFAEIISRAAADRECRGCFLINSAIEVAPHDAELATVVNHNLDLIRGFFHRQLAGAGRSGEIDRRLTTREAADHLLAVLLGIRVLSRTRPDGKLLGSIAASALRALGIPARRLKLLGKPRNSSSGRRAVRH